MTTRFPQSFGRFWLQEKIGHGGMAEVFRATVGPDPETYAFDIALKRLHPHLESDKTQVDMFMTEADVAKFLLHENIVRVYEAGLFEGHAYIAMEYVWGLDLAQVMLRLRQRRVRLPADLAVFISLQILRALDYVHRAVAPGGAPMNMVHRDVTPSNIYLTYDGQVKLADFGVARVSFLEGHEDNQTLKGKVSYMPPEVLAGHPVDPMLDIWSLSVTLYEMVTMRRVYEGVSEADLVAGLVAPRIEAAHKVSGDVDLALSKILTNALHKKRKRRPKEAVDLYRSLKSYLAEIGIMHQQDALGRFLREAVGASGTPATSAPASSTDSDNFLESDYHAPIEMSPTQRLQLTDRRRRWVVPAVAAATFVTLSGAGAWWYASKAVEQPIEPPVSADASTES
ncbi:MAG: serine/threonine-protein kinase, partial [Myxococcota bacterium]